MRLKKLKALCITLALAISSPAFAQQKITTIKPGQTAKQALKHNYKSRQILYEFPKNTNLHYLFPEGLTGNRMEQFHLWNNLPTKTTVYKLDQKKDAQFEEIKVLENKQLEDYLQKTEISELTPKSLNYIMQQTSNEEVTFHFLKKYYGSKQLRNLNKALKAEVRKGGFGPKSHEIHKKITKIEKGSNIKMEDANAAAEPMRSTILQKNDLYTKLKNFEEYYAPYNLNFKQYEKIQNLVKEKKLVKDYEIKKSIRLEKILEHENFLDKISQHYKINKNKLLEIFNQESCFNICAEGTAGEAGLGQIKETTARMLVKLISNYRSDLHYPQFDKKNYSFANLTKDYELNMILAAAQIKVADEIYHRTLKNARLSPARLAAIVKWKGERTKFKKLTKSQKGIFESYKISWSRAKQVNKFWKNKKAVDEEDLFYLVYNGGGKATRNIRKNTALAELLLYNLTVFSENKEKLGKIILLNYGNLENMLKANTNTIQSLEVGEQANIWDNEIYNVSKKTLQSYLNKNLIRKGEKLKPLLQKENLTIIDTGKEKHFLNKDLSIGEEVNNKDFKTLTSLNHIESLYENLELMKQLKKTQQTLNKASHSKNWRQYKIELNKVKDIEKKLERKHTGIQKIKKDLNKLKKEIRNSGFVAE